MADTKKQLIDIDGLSTFLTKLRTEISNTISNIAEATTSAKGFMSASDKTKIDGIAEGAQVNVIEAISVNGTTQTITNKAIALVIPSSIAYSSTQPTTGEDYWEQPY